MTYLQTFIYNSDQLNLREHGSSFVRFAGSDLSPFHLRQTHTVPTQPSYTSTDTPRDLKHLRDYTGSSVSGKHPIYI